MVRLFVYLILFSISLNAEKLVFGVLEYKGKEKVIKQYTPLAEYIQDQINIPVELKVLSQEALENEVRLNKIDIVATNPTHFIALRENGNLTGAIATEIKSYKGKETSYLGGVIITRSDRRDIRELTDLQYCTIAYPGKKFLGGWQSQQYELLKAGVHLNEQSLVQTKKHEIVVEKVLSKEVDVGFIRTGIIEEMIADGKLKRSDIFVINEQKIDHFPWIVSTSLYPEWAIAVDTNLGTGLIKRIAAAIYVYSPKNHADGEIEGFSIPADYTNVDSLARELRLPPYENRPRFTLLDVWHEYDNTIVGLIISFIINLFLLLFLYRSIKKLNKSKMELAHSATHDSLTGLYNRRGMGKMLTYILGSLKRNDTYAAIIYIDLDNFKPLNDLYGHSIGDKLLIEVSNRFTTSVRALDIVSRVGGDEFVIILTDLEGDEIVSMKSAIAVAEKIRHRINKPYHFLNESGLEIVHTLSASMGIVTFNYAANMDTIILSADKAMYEAKEKGRDQIVCYHNLVI